MVCLSLRITNSAHSAVVFLDLAYLCRCLSASHVLHFSACMSVCIFTWLPLIRNKTSTPYRCEKLRAVVVQEPDIVWCMQLENRRRNACCQKRNLEEKQQSKTHRSWFRVCEYLVPVRKQTSGDSLPARLSSGLRACRRMLDCRKSPSVLAMAALLLSLAVRSFARCCRAVRAARTAALTK